MTNEILTPVQGIPPMPVPARDDDGAEFRQAAIPSRQDAWHHYVRDIPGRLRVRAGATKRNPANADALKTAIEGLNGQPVSKDCRSGTTAAARLARVVLTTVLENAVEKWVKAGLAALL